MHTHFTFLCCLWIYSNVNLWAYNSQTLNHSTKPGTVWVLARTYLDTFNWFKSFLIRIPKGCSLNLWCFSDVFFYGSKGASNSTKGANSKTARWKGWFPAKRGQTHTREFQVWWYVALRYVTLHFKFRHRVLEKWPKIALFVLRRQIYLNLQSWTKVLGQICICRTFWNYSCSIPLPTQQTTLDAGVYKEYFSSLNIVYCVRGRIFTDNCEYCVTFPRIFVQDCFSWYCCKRKVSCS